MRPAIPGFGFVLSTAATLWGCGGAGRLHAQTTAEAKATTGPAMAADMAPAAPAEAPQPGAPPPPKAAGGERAALTAQVGTAQAPTREMLDIEGRVTVQVPKVKPALKALRDLAARSGGVITEERVDTASEYGAAQVTLRVPSAAATSVFEAMDGLGTVLEQNVTARDVGKEFYDANLRLSSLEATQRRYEEILKQAGNVEEILRIEQELSRLRTEIEQVKGNLRWLSDRTARATVHVSLREQRAVVVTEREPDIKFFPGLRLTGMVDFKERPAEGYVGVGFDLRFSRAFSLDLDVLQRPGGGEPGVDAILASLGGETRSALLRERSYLNPYLGWRAGYARLGSDNQALVGATLGVELFHNRLFGLDLEARNYLAFGGPRGAHYLLTPALAANIAF